MKKLILLVMVFITGMTYVFAQSPEGMNYQAVARNLQGDILANQPVSLRVSLFGMSANNVKTEYYRETQNTRTSTVGVFSVVVGRGNVLSGRMKDVPFSTENIWMEVAIKSAGNGDFVTISNSKLMAVPYAFHAMTAEKLSGSAPTSSATSPGSPSNNWITYANAGTNPLVDKLGTSDSVDLIIVSNNQERIRVFGNGNVNIKKNTNNEGTLTVQKSTFLNQTSGSTINYGDFTVDRKSNTFLSGKLTVDSSTDLNQSLNVDGVTDLNSRLNVNNQSPTFLSGALTVNGITNLNNAFNVNNISPSILSGTLQVNKDAVFKEKVLLDNATHQSTLPTNGALVVNGGVGIGGNLNVAGESKFGGPVQFAGAVSITDETQSTNTTTGALKITGGVGIGKRLNVGEATAIGGTLTVANKLTVNETIESTSATTGSVTTAGGMGIAKNTNIGGTLTVAKATTVNNTLNVITTTDNLSGSYVANFTNNSPTGANGISIQVNADNPTNSNDFITFKNNKGIPVGRIEGEREGDLGNNQEYQDALIFKGIAIGFASADAIIAALESVQGGIKVVASATSSTACVGFGACFTVPIPSLIIESGSNLILKIANAVKYVAAIGIASADLATFKSHKMASLGVTYQSGSADYAEWLAKKDLTETFNAGDIVCMKNGFISKNIEEGGKMMVISQKPIVLGNTPKEGNEANYAKVAFLGQVPVKVLGPVKMGDYILPAGFNKGFGIAVSPEKMTINDYKKIVGVSWETAEGNPYSYVNTAVGLNANDYASVIETQDQKIKKQDEQIAELRSMIEQTNKMVASMTSGAVNANNPVKNVRPAQPAVQNNNNSGIKFITPEMNPVVPDQNTVVYSQLTTQQLDQMFEMAEKVFVQAGGKFEEDAFWSKIKKDPSFKQSIRQRVTDEYDKALKLHNEANRAR